MATTATPKRVDISILKAAELAAAAAIKEAREGKTFCQCAPTRE